MLLSPTHPICIHGPGGQRVQCRSRVERGNGRLIGWLSNFGAVVIPTVGFFIRSQAFFHALISREASALCGNARTLVGLGFADDEAEKFENQLRSLACWSTSLARRRQKRCGPAKYCSTRVHSESCNLGREMTRAAQPPQQPEVN